MTPKIHTIQQQHLHVKLDGNESDGLALQKRLPDLCQTWLAPALDQVLDRYAPPEGHLIIERLEIDVGTLNLERLEHDLVQSVTQAVEKILRDFSQPRQTLPSTVSNNVQHKTEQQFILDAFLYFLRRGRLPWSFRVQGGKNLEQAILDSWQEKPSSPSSDAVCSVLALPSARKRLVQQFSEAFLATLLERIAPDIKKIMDGILYRLKNTAPPDDAVKPFITQLWETAFALIPTTGHCTESRLIGTAWHKLPVTAAQQSPLTILLERHWPGVTSNAGTSQKSSNAADTPQQFSKTDKKKMSDHALLTSENIANSNLDPIISLVRETQQSNQQPEERAGIYIENAGLVLLHPFLPQFFEALKIADEDALIQPDRALCLLHFLTTGQRIAPEYELVLPKILCNIPLETPVESGTQLTGSEIEEATALLEAVIRHWDVLKNTGADGLRGAFLLRTGKITLRNDGDWRLQVESKAYDILLDKLPWGIGMIKLPWMQRMLWVEWAC